MEVYSIPTTPATSQDLGFVTNSASPAFIPSEGEIMYPTTGSTEREPALTIVNLPRHSYRKIGLPVYGWNLMPNGCHSLRSKVYIFTLHGYSFYYALQLEHFVVAITVVTSVSSLISYNITCGFVVASFPDLLRLRS